MSYDGRVFTILIASPGDVQAERDMISQIVHEWNYVNSRERGTVLLPLRWETHASPELGGGPQEIINRQVVDGCDIAVGVFWTRLGTPTQTAESGTAEEIARVNSGGKPVMLYFSKAPAALDLVDPEELVRLRRFKSGSYPNGLVESYSSIQEFRDKFSRQLSFKMAELITTDARQRSEQVEAAEDSPAGSDLLSLLAFAKGSDDPLAEVLIVERIKCTNSSEIPKYTGQDAQPQSTVSASGGMVIASAATSNPNYYRQMVDYIENKSGEVALRLGLRAKDRAVRDIHTQVTIRSEGGLAVDGSSTLALPQKMIEHSYISTFNFLNSPQPTVAASGPDSWIAEYDTQVAQIERTIAFNSFFMRVSTSSTVDFEATIYSSNSRPFVLTKSLNLEVVERELTYQEILARFGIKLA